MEADIAAWMTRIERKLDELLTRSRSGRQTRVEDRQPVRKGWLRLEEASAITGLKQKTLRAACATGRIQESYKTNDGRWRVSVAAAEHIRDHGLPRVDDSRVLSS